MSKPRVMAYTILHYGRDYLRWSIRSIADACERIDLHYSDKPNCGVGAQWPCPDNASALKHQVAAAKIDFEDPDTGWPGPIPMSVKWVDSPDGLSYGETSHNAQLALEAAGADLILNIDADEVWDPKALARALQFVWSCSESERRRHWRVPFIHFWRSAHWVCTDNMNPQRIIDLRVPHDDKSREFGFIDPGCPVLHFGYAQRAEVVKYKMHIHNHRREFRRADWYESVFESWRPSSADEAPGDVHPTCVGIWNPRPIGQVSPRAFEAVRRELYDHPFLGFDVIP